MPNTPDVSSRTTEVKLYRCAQCGERYSEFETHTCAAPPQDAGAGAVARAISTYIAAIACRLQHGPMDRVPQEELDAFDAMQAALGRIEDNGYDKGYRTAVAGLMRPGGRLDRTEHEIERLTRERDEARQEVIRYSAGCARDTALLLESERAREELQTVTDAALAALIVVPEVVGFAEYDQRAVDVIKNLVMLVRRLAYSHPNQKLVDSALAYLRGESLQGSPLRVESSAPSTPGEEKAGHDEPSFDEPNGDALLGEGGIDWPEDEHAR